MSDWSTAVDRYCERIDPSFWAEPANALTNVSFFIAAVAAWLCWRRRAERDWPVLALILVTVAVGTGSFLFHTLATRGAAWLDVIPIAAFIYGYLFLALRRFLALGALASAGVLIAFSALSLGLQKSLPADFLNGSGGYLPALFAMLAVGGMTRGTAAGRGVLANAGVFAVSLVFRSIDNAICPAFPLGTHFLWHALNGLVLYLLLRAAMAAGPRPAAVRAA